MQVEKPQDEVGVSYVCWGCTGRTGRRGTCPGVRTQFFFFAMAYPNINLSPSTHSSFQNNELQDSYIQLYLTLLDFHNLQYEVYIKLDFCFIFIRGTSLVRVQDLVWRPELL